jgi:predicted transcriptional regulator YheO
MQMITININFDSLESAQEFIKDYQHIQKKKTRPKKENDLRGHKTKEFHNAVKQFQEQNPDKTYLECLKQSKENK